MNYVELRSLVIQTFRARKRPSVDPRTEIHKRKLVEGIGPLFNLKGNQEGFRSISLF